MNKSTKIFGALISALAIGTAAVGSYILVTHLNSDKNGMYEAIEIANLNSPYVTDTDLGIINPGETVKQEIVIESVINSNVDFNMYFTCEQDSVLLEYISISISMGDTLLSEGDTLKNCIENNLQFSSSLNPKETKLMTINYTLADADIPLNEPLDFQIVIEASSRSIL